MGELRGRPDAPPEEPAKAAPDRARAPDPPSNSNNDPRAIRDAFRRAEDPAFADPRVQTRYVTDRNPDTGPASIRPYRTSQDRPEPEPERPDTPTARTLEAETPRVGDDVLNEEPTDKRKFDEAREELWGNIDEICETTQKLGDKVDDMLGRMLPTGQHTQEAPRETIWDPMHPHGLDGGSATAAMLAAGLVLGEGARLAYRKTSELREKLNAGHR